MSDVRDCDDCVFSEGVRGSAAIGAHNALLRILSASRERRSAYYTMDYGSLGSTRRSPYADLMIAAFELYLESEDWAQQRQKCLVSLGGKCRRCGAEATVAHHADYRHWSCGDRELHSLVPLCAKCHAQEHAHEAVRDATPFFAKRDARDHTSWVDDDVLSADILAVWQKLDGDAPQSA